jgi:hypothetical protein
MSLSYQHLNSVLVRDPRTIVQSQRDYAILKAGSQTTWKAWTSTSISNSSIQFSTPPPSGGVFVDSKQYFYLPVRLTFTGIPAVGNTILNLGFDAPRAYPISNATDTLSVTINNQSVSINLADIIQCISHFNTDPELKNGNYSAFPNYCDQSQQYNDLVGANRNPLGTYADGIDGAIMQRGGFPYIIVANPVQAVLGTLLTAVVDVAFCEPIFLPPFYFGNSNRQAFFNVNSIDFNFTFIGGVASRMWSHNDQGGTNVILSAQANFGGTTGGPQSALAGGTLPLILAQYITPQETQIISPEMPITYPYFDIQRYPTQMSPLAAGASTIMISNNIQLSSIPRRLYVFVREQNVVLQSNPSFTDTFFALSNLSIQFMNKNGLLASASPQQLYYMSQKNHCNLNWTQWSGAPAGASGVGVTSVFGVGSLICVEFATDIGLDSLEAPGKLGQYMLQVQVNATNISARTIAPVLYLVPILEGTFTIPQLGRALINIGVITSQDILDAQGKPEYNYADVEAVQGGNFFSGIKDFFTNKVFPAIKNFVGNKGISKTLGMIPHPAAQIGSTIGSLFGLGNEGMGMHGNGVMAAGMMNQMHHGQGAMAGAMAGEGALPRHDLRKRMKHY